MASLRTGNAFVCVGRHHGPPASSGGPFELDTLIIPGGCGLRRPKVVRELTPVLRQVANRTRRVASVCTGIYALAETGLLDGRRVATHWRFADDVAQKFPALRVDRDALFVKDEKYYSSAGVTAAKWA